MKVDTVAAIVGKITALVALLTLLPGINSPSLPLVVCDSDLRVNTFPRIQSTEVHILIFFIQYSVVLCTQDGTRHVCRKYGYSEIVRLDYLAAFSPIALMYLTESMVRDSISETELVFKTELTGQLTQQEILVHFFAETDCFNGCACY